MPAVLGSTPRGFREFRVIFSDVVVMASFQAGAGTRWPMMRPEMFKGNRRKNSLDVRGFGWSSK